MSDDPVPTPPPMDDDSFGTPVPPPMIDAGGLPVPGMGKLSEKDDRTFGMLAHLLGALTSFVGPLVIWLIKKDESPFVDDQGKEALNFQITVSIGYLISVVASFIPFIGCLTMLLFPVLWVFSLIFGILGCLEANRGVGYRYPFTLRLINQ